MTTIGDYTLGPEIGKGSFATVYKCHHSKTHAAVAVKSVVRSKLKSKKLVENLEIEISILKNMKHPHIVGLIDYTQTSTHFHLVMDYCSMGDLSYFIRKRNQLVKNHPVISSLLERYPSPEGSHGLNETLVIHFLKQLSSALSFLREKSLVHRDIKPQNLLLCPPAHSKSDFEKGGYVGLWELPILKIADFGFARFLPSTSMAETLCGSPLYMAPEILRYEKYNAKADLWSVGAVLYEMVVGKPPFKAANHIELLKNIEKSNDKIKFPSSAQVPESIKRLIRALLKYNPTERVSFNEFFNDQLITCALDGNDEPLETSHMDENLFISEYISPIKRSQVIQPLRPVSSRNSAIDRLPRHSPQPLSGSESRDEEIKQLINKNSPGPEVTSQSIVTRERPGKGRDDIVLERDYVVVEKRAVEVNAIADELAAAGTAAVAIRARRSLQDSTSSPDSNKMFRRGSLRSNSSGSQRRPSFTDRRISVSISPTTALSKAIGLASNRLFGSSATQQITEETAKELSNEFSGAMTLNNTFSTVISNPHFANHLLLQKLNLPTSLVIASLEAEASPKNEDEAMVIKLEGLVTKAHAVNLFADVKFSQLIPSPPSSEGVEDDVFHQNDLLPPRIVKAISEEGVVLYVKTLSLLAKGMTLASEWWYSKNHIGDQAPTDDGSRQSTDVAISVRVNELVQWIREKFNESLEKAEFIKLRLQEADSQIQKEYLVSQASNVEDTQTVSKSLEGTKVVAEKLIFDRALEMSRNAAVSELVKEDLKGCELAYSTAIWMLEALLDDDGNDVLDDDDRGMVEKFIVSIGNRLGVLKRKLESTET
ncbi:Serine/threonine-protein kinase [Naganishia cerealis]|uniref:Serine/threonine-protein kinase n=1 Tax=Naganishia cerealis TaxID=610337 RepID=A0ACC2WFQ3_9TREE|nr:Serine/threonine-protein kinase [Naganishia cerealis]